MKHTLLLLQALPKHLLKILGWCLFQFICHWLLCMANADDSYTFMLCSGPCRSMHGCISCMVDVFVSLHRWFSASWCFAWLLHCPKHTVFVAFFITFLTFICISLSITALKTFCQKTEAEISWQIYRACFGRIVSEMYVLSSICDLITLSEVIVHKWRPLQHNIQDLKLWY